MALSLAGMRPCAAFIPLLTELLEVRTVAGHAPARSWRAASSSARPCTARLINVLESCAVRFRKLGGSSGCGILQLCASTPSDMAEHFPAHAIHGQGAMDASNLLKPMLGRGELRCIGATTLDEYRKYIEKDPALERRFQQVYVGQPSVVDTIAILRGLKERCGGSLTGTASVICARSRSLPCRACAQLLDGTSSNACLGKTRLFSTGVSASPQAGAAFCAWLS